MKKFLLIIILHCTFYTIHCFSQQSGWQILPSGTTSEFKSVHFIDPFDLYMCGSLIHHLKSTDGGLTWQISSYPVPFTLNDIFVIDEFKIVAVGDEGTIMRTTDGGAGWTFISSGVTDDLLSVSFVDSFGICGARSQTILYSSNSGASWNIAQSGFIGGGFWGAVMLSPQIGFLAGENSIFQPLLGKTTDSGQNWNFIPFYLNNNEGRATGVDFTDVYIGYASSRVWDGRGAISKTTNSGNTWVTTFFNNPLWGIDFPISNASQGGYAVGDSGVILKTYNAGTSWQAQQSGTSLRLNKVYFIDLDFGFAVGDSGIILRTTTGGEPVILVDNDKSPVYEFKLSQNYPNPFNPATKIRFTISQSPLLGGDGRGGFVTLKVYDVLGNEVTTLVNEELNSGSYEVDFDATGLTSGIYFYQLSATGGAGEFVETKKMILMR